MDVGVATPLSSVDGLNGGGVGDNNGDCDGGRDGNSDSTLGRGVDKAVTGVGVEGDTEDRGCGTSGSKGCSFAGDFFVETVHGSGGGRFFDDSENIPARDNASVLTSLSL